MKLNSDQHFKKINSILLLLLIGICSVGAYFEALDDGVLLVPLDPRYTRVGFNLVSVQVWIF